VAYKIHYSDYPGNDTGPPVGSFLPLTGGTVTGPTEFHSTTDNALKIFTDFAGPANGISGIYASTTNRGPHMNSGVRFDYFSMGKEAGFDTAMSVLGLYDPILPVTSGIAVYQAAWLVAQSPNDPVNNFCCLIAELDVVNRGKDAGWMRDRTSANPTGGLLMVAENLTFGGGAGEGKNATWAYSVSRSGLPNSTGFPVKFYNGYLIEPNSIVGQTGRAIYMTGDITGTGALYPYGPLQTDGAWMHGIDHTRAVYNDGYAETMLVGQRVGWIVGTTGSATAVASINATGSGTDATLVLTPSGAGTITLAGSVTGPNLQIGQGTGGQSVTVNGASGADTGFIWAAANNQRWKLSTDASSNLFLYSYNASGGYLGSVFAAASTLFQLQVPFYCGMAGFNGTAPIAKPTVTGSKGANTALASLLTALAAYGLVTDSST
jgi:hypothetical protein